jgi:hypothetical protein
MAEESASGAGPPDPGRAWIAEIAWDTEGEVCRFSVLARSEADAEDSVVAVSEALEWPPSGPAEVEALNAAVEALAAELAAAGWIARPPGEAWYARRFEWAPAAREAVPAAVEAPATVEAPAPTLFARSPDWPAGSKKLWRCEIRWTAGWVDSRFEVVVRRPGGLRSRPIGVSAPLQPVLKGPPDAGSAEAETALRALVSALETAGWRPAGRGAAWYAHRFTWSGAGKPPDRVEPAPGSADEQETLERDPGPLWVLPHEDQLDVKQGTSRAYESRVSPSPEELERLLRAARPAPREEFVSELERCLPLHRSERVRPPRRRRRFRLAIGAVSLATGLAFVALLLSIVGLLPFGEGERPARAGRECRTVTVERRERVPVFVRDKEGNPTVRYELRTVPHLVRRCR